MSIQQNDNKKVPIVQNEMCRAMLKAAVWIVILGCSRQELSGESTADVGDSALDASGAISSVQGGGDSAIAPGIGGTGSAGTNGSHGSIRDGGSGAQANIPSDAGVGLPLELVLVAEPAEVQVLPGRPTSVWRYRGEVLSGDRNAVMPLAGSYLGPIIRVRKGQRVRVRFENRVNEPTIVHWHGLLVPPEMDGHPRDVVQPGGQYVYEFEVRNRAGTYWFHPHPHMLTGPQVYRGLAGLFLVSDAEETAAALPTGEFDLPFVIQDRTFDQNNQLVYGTMMMDSMMGFLGDRILVNGQPDFVLSAARRSYRLRLLNGSNSRIYKLAWEDSSPLTVIGTDDGLLEEPVQRGYVTLGPAERVELWVDFAHWQLGEQVRLISLPFTGGGMDEMMGSGMANGSKFPVLTAKIEFPATETTPLPQRLTTVRRYSEQDSVNVDQPRTFRPTMGGMNMRGMMGTNMGGVGSMAGTIMMGFNGRSFEMDAVTQNEIVRLNTQETWVFDNTGSMNGGMMMPMPHPMHVHSVYMQVVDRQILPAFANAWQSVREGFVDEGWKDTVLVMPGEQVKVLLRFQDFSGLYMYHCHNLEHEDLGMMRNYRVDPP